jgi:hypothetical protein
VTTWTGSTHPCPTNRHDKPPKVRDDLLMCGGCWHMVPAALQRPVWRAWRHGKGRGTPEHARACDAAIAAVNAQLEDAVQPEAGLVEYRPGCPDHGDQPLDDCPECAAAFFRSLRQDPDP